MDPAIPDPGPVGGRSASRRFASSAAAGIGRTGARGLAALEAAVPVAARLVGVFNVYSWVVVGASVLIVAIVAAVARPVTVGSIVPFVLLIALLAVPCILLRLFHGALTEVLEMPAWLRTSPDLVRDHGADLARIAGEAAVHGRDRLWSVPGDIFRSGRLLMRAHGDLPEYGRLIRLVNVPFLFGVLVSFLAGFMIIAFSALFVITLPVVLLLR